LKIVESTGKALCILDMQQLYDWCAFNLRHYLTPLSDAFDLKKNHVARIPPL